jgi:hypothetical protein
MQPCSQNCPRTKGQSAKKEVCFAHRILVFHFFPLFFLLLMVLHDVIFNVNLYLTNYGQLRVKLRVLGF